MVLDGSFVDDFIAKAGLEAKDSPKNQPVNNDAQD
jgi:hypothetical protein